jgi:1,4-alpha-glucan branching enzyme
MDKVLYDMMDWAAIEEMVYSEAPEPKQTVGAHLTDNGFLVQTFQPGAQAVSVAVADGKTYPMELADEEGFFAVLVPAKTKKMKKYTLQITDGEGNVKEIYDPYSFDSIYDETDLKKFEAGIYYDVYKKMGAHPMTIDGVEGVSFSVWAPCAMRVSVVGDFNNWDGRLHQMNRIGNSGIFEIFLPGLKIGDIYKYEIKTKRGEPMLKSDPYGNFCELRPNNASVIWDITKFEWSDDAWMKARKKAPKEQPMSIYELHLGSWIRKPIEIDADGKEIVGSEYYNYRKIAPKLAAYIKEMGYTHVELMPVMEHPFDGSWGYQVTGYYAPTSRYGTPDDFQYFMNYMHEQGIGVILDWVPAHFPRDAFGLAAFDGTHVYEHADPRQGSHPHWGTLIYNYGRPQVSNFLIANALFWAEQYHADGIRMDAVASMLYLDYGKNDGEWVANIYGGHENLEAVEFLKHLNSIFKKRTDGAILIAEESTAWPMITGDVKDNGLGFDYKWNMGWMNDFTRYLKCDPYFRNYNYGDLTFSMLYAYSEKFVLVFSHDEVVHGKCSMLCKMPGVTYEEKANNLRAAYGFMYGHPGKKLLFMGQEFAQVSEWNEAEELPWNILKYPVHKSTQDYVKALNKLYLTQPAMYKKDDEPEGFQWINCSDRENNIVSFVRKTDKPEETLLFICNFAPVEHEKYQLGVPFYGKYKEILNSDSKEFGGRGKGNPRAITSKQIECDEHANSITIDLPPMSTVIFSCTPTAEPKKKAVTEKKATTEKKAATEKKIAEKTTAAKKTTKTAKTLAAEETAPVAEVKAEAPAEKKTTAKKAQAAKKTSAPKKTAAKKVTEEK